VSLTLPQPTRLVALVAALVLTGLAAIVFLLGRGALGGESAAPTAPVAHATRSAIHKPAATHPTKAAPKPAPKPHVSSGFPARIDHALRYSRVVVVSVSMPGAAVDAQVRSEARAGAKASGASFVRLSALNDVAMSELMAKTGVLPDPAVVIVTRPGSVVATFSVTDAGTIAQAVAEARR
jgi:hypothetical protein